MDAATVGILATGTLGVIGTLTTFFAPPWTARKIEQRRERRDFRTAQRLVSDELDLLGIHLQSILDTDWVTRDELESELILNRSEWSQHKNTLASSVDAAVWKLVQNAYRQVEATRAVLLESGDDKLTDNVTEFVQRDTKRCELARDALQAASFTPDEHAPSWLTRVKSFKTHRRRPEAPS